MKKYYLDYFIQIKSHARQEVLNTNQTKKWLLSGTEIKAQEVLPFHYVIILMRITILFREEAFNFFNPNPGMLCFAIYPHSV